MPHPDIVHEINALSVLAMMAALKQSAESLDQLIHFGSHGEFPETEFRRALNITQANHDPSLRLTAEEIEMMCELGRLAHEMGNLPRAVEYHQRAAKFRDILERRANAGFKF